MNQANVANESFVRQFQTALRERGMYSGAIDGWAGSQTAAAFQALLQATPGAKKGVSALPSRANSSRLYDLLEKDIGIKEVPGKESHPRIKLAIQTAAMWLDPDDSITSWCGCILGLCCKELKLAVPAEHYRAASWLNIGEVVTIDKAVKGDIVVLTRKGGNHVGLYHSHTAAHITLLGGNQSNSVNLTRFSLGMLRGIRRL